MLFSITIKESRKSTHCLKQLYQFRRWESNKLLRKMLSNKTLIVHQKSLVKVRTKWYSLLLKRKEKKPFKNQYYEKTLDCVKNPFLRKTKSMRC